MISFSRCVVPVASHRAQEVHRWTDPSYSLKLAMFTYGLMCDVLPRNTWLAAGYPGGGGLRRRSTFSALAQATTATGTEQTGGGTGTDGDVAMAVATAPSDNED